MGAAIRLRADYDGARLRDLAKRSRNGAQARRLLALAEIYDGRRRSDAARQHEAGELTLQERIFRGLAPRRNERGAGRQSKRSRRAASKRQEIEEPVRPSLVHQSRQAVLAIGPDQDAVAMKHLLHLAG